MGSWKERWLIFMNKFVNLVIFSPLHKLWYFYTVHKTSFMKISKYFECIISQGFSVKAESVVSNISNLPFELKYI